jgi:Mce-associated membrane protein
LLAVLTLLFFATTVLFGWMAFAPRSAPIKPPAVAGAPSGDENEITDVASRFTSNLLTYKSTTVDADFKKALGDATPEFGVKRIPAFGDRTIAAVKEEVKTNKSTSSTRVKAASITDNNQDTATVVVVATRTYVSKGQEGQELPALELTLVNTGDGWKVDNAAPLGQD